MTSNTPPTTEFERISHERNVAVEELRVLRAEVCELRSELRAARNVLEAAERLREAALRASQYGGFVPRTPPDHLIEEWEDAAGLVGMAAHDYAHRNEEL